MQNDKGVVARLCSLLGLGEKAVRYSLFKDFQGNFEIQYPSDWRFDRNVAVIDGKYTISFESKDGLCRFAVAVDSNLPVDFDFTAYAKAELDVPSSGVYTALKAERFREMEAYSRDFAYACSGRRFFSGSIMFYTGLAVFSINWSAPEKRRKALDAVFVHMLRSIVVRETAVVRKRQAALEKKLAQIESLKNARET